MLSLVTPPSPQADEQHDPSSPNNTLSRWQFYQQHGHSYHHNKQFSKAIACFKASHIMSWDWVRHHQPCPNEAQAWDLLFSATHNLSACYNAIGNNRESTRLLKELHQYLVSTISNTSRLRTERLEALAILDKSLFSLASQLAYENQTNEIHKLIINTESTANQASSELLSA